MIDLDYYKTIASDESELSPKGFEFKIVLRELIADIEREQYEKRKKLAQAFPLSDKQIDELHNWILKNY